MASDGVSPGLDDGWLLDMLRETEEPDVKALARSVLRRAADEYGNSDDPPRRNDRQCVSQYSSVGYNPSVSFECPFIPLQTQM